jgi:hypothetical protein
MILSVLTTSLLLACPVGVDCGVHEVQPTHPGATTCTQGVGGASSSRRFFRLDYNSGHQTQLFQTTRPARAQPAAKPVKEVEPIVLAIQALTKEFEEARKINSSLPRSKSDYFNTVDKPPLEQVLKALSQKTAKNAEADAYVRFQLLSALPGKLEGELGVQAARLLAVAPELLPMPSSTMNERRELDKIAQQTKEANLTDVMAQWQSHVQQFEDRNQTNLDYRNQLFTRLPASRVKVDAALEDLRQRIAAGVPVADYFRTIAQDIRAYAQQSGNPSEMRQIGQSVRMLADQAKTTVYDTIEFNAQQRRAIWKTRDIRIDSTAAKDLIEFLNGRERSPEGK